MIHYVDDIKKGRTIDVIQLSNCGQLTMNFTNKIQEVTCKECNKIRNNMKMKNKKYVEAVNWIAGNDEPTLLNWIDMRDLISVALVADLFAVSSDDVAKDVIMVRLYGNIKGKPNEKQK